MENAHIRRQVLVIASTFPSSDKDPVPGFVKDQVVSLKKLKPNIDFSVLAPYDSGSKPEPFTKHPEYDEYRFNYILPKRLARLAGRGIVPSLRRNKLLYLLVPFFVLFEFVSLFRLVRKLEPGVIYAHWFTPQAIVAALVSSLTKTPLVFTTHSSDLIVLKSFPFHKRVIKYVMRRTYRWTAVSKHTVDKARTVFSKAMWNEYKAKLQVIPMGIDSTSIAAFNVKNVRERLKLLNNKEVILFIGRLAEIKGVDRLIYAFSELKHANSVLVIAGEGPEKANYIKLTQKLGVSSNIRFVGYVHSDEKNYLLSIANALVVPSVMDSGGHTEGMPVVIMEGLAAGNIVIASDKSNASEIIDNGTNGYIYDSENTSELSRSIKEVLTMDKSQRAEMESAAKKLSYSFEWSTIAERHYDYLFKELVE